MEYIDEKDMSSFVKVNTSSWETVNEDVFVRFINLKYLNKYSSDIVHRKFLDLAMCASVQEKKEDKFRSHMLTQSDLERYGIDINTVFAAAMRNTENARSLRILTPAEHMCMNHPAYPLMGKIEARCMVGAGGAQNIPLGVIGGTDENDNILILADKRFGYGSSYIASHKVLEDVYKKFDNKNFYVVPTNAFYVMCIKASFVTQDGSKPLREAEDDLMDMLESMNDKCKSWKDILSYKIYYYFGDDSKALFLIK